MSKAHAIVVEFSRHSAIRRLLLLISSDNAAVVEPIGATIGVTTCLSHVGSGPKQPDCISPARSRFEWPPGPDTLQEGRRGKRQAFRLLSHVRSRRMRHIIIGPGLRHPSHEARNNSGRPVTQGRVWAAASTATLREGIDKDIEGIWEAWNLLILALGRPFWGPGGPLTSLDR